MAKQNPKNGDETKSDTLPWDILESDIIFHWLQKTKTTE